MKDQYITECSNSRTPDHETPIPSEAITASPGLNARESHGSILDRGKHFASSNFHTKEIKTMITNTFKLTGMTVAIALAAGTLGAGQAYAYDIATTQTYDLKKVASYTKKGSLLAPIAAKPNGGAYIQWATAESWNGGGARAAARVYVTEVDNLGKVIDANGNAAGTDIDLGIGRPGGIAASTNSFGYYLIEGDKSTFSVNGESSTLVMDHRNAADRAAQNYHAQQGVLQTFNRGLRFPATGDPAFGWRVPFLPDGSGRSVAFGDGHFGTVFAHANSFANAGVHWGQSSIFFGANGSTPTKGSIWSPSHSIDQRVIFDSSNKNFYTVGLGDWYPMDIHIRTHNSTGTETTTTDKNLFQTAANTVPYFDVQGTRIQNIRTGTSSNGDLWGMGSHAAHLGDLHAIGDGSVAITYAHFPRVTQRSGHDRRESTKNQVELALLDNQGKMTRRKVVYAVDGKVGQGSYTAAHPYARVQWVKSAKVGNNFLIFFKTETWDGQARHGIDAIYGNNEPRYTDSNSVVRMIEVDGQGNVVVTAGTVPNSIGFHYRDRLETLSNGTVAWTYSGDNTLKLNMLAPPDLPGNLPTSPPPAPTAKAATNITSDGFTASWNADNGASSYRIDVSTDNFQTFMVENLVVSGTSHKLSNLPPSTTYQYRVRSFNNAGGGQNSNVITAQTAARPTLPIACSPTGSIPNQNNSINKFELKDAQSNVAFLNTLNDSSARYEDFTHRVIQTNSGAVFNYTVTGGGNGATDIWIDLNNNGTFELNPERLVYNTDANNRKGKLTIPTTLTPGFYRLRVRVMPNYQSNPCNGNQYSQTEDYTLQIGTGTGTGTPSTLHINVAGSNVTTSMGDFTALPAVQVSGGTDWNTNRAVANTTDDALYQRQRYGQMQFNIPVSDGSYTVRLHFADLYWSTAGKRVFNVDIEGNQVLSDFDVIAEAGSNNTALVKTFTVQVSDQNLDLDFINVTENAIISAIEIIPGSGTTQTPVAFKAALQGAQSNKCVDVPAINTADNLGIVQWTCNGGPNQKMTFTPVTGKADVYKLVFDHSNKCLHMPGTSNGTDLVQMTCDNSTSQQFKLESVGDNLYKLTAQNSGKGLDVENGSGADGGIIQQWTYGGGQHQKWTVVRDL